MSLLTKAISRMLAMEEIWGSDGILPARVEPGARGTKVVIATGANACGKSFACRFLATSVANVRTEEEDVKDGEFFNISMRMRTESTGGFFSAKTFVYGREGDASTGSTSLRAVNGAFRNSRERPTRHVIALDEPEVGLSDEFAMALGNKILGFAHEMPKKCDALIVVSHSRAMISTLMQLEPHCLRFDPMSTREWLNTQPAAASIEDLDGLEDRNLETWRAIQRLEDDFKRAKAAEEAAAAKPSGRRR